jgi:hypothetical protein
MKIIHPNFSGLAATCFMIAGMFLSADARAETYTSCKFKLVDKIGGFYNSEWLYRFQRYNGEVVSPDKLPLEAFFSLINEKVKAHVKNDYKETIENNLETKRIIVSLRESEVDGLAQWFYHYERRLWGSGPQDTEVSHQYYVELDSLSCL